MTITVKLYLMILCGAVMSMIDNADIDKNLDALFDGMRKRYKRYIEHNLQQGQQFELDIMMILHEPTGLSGFDAYKDRYIGGSSYRYYGVKK